MFDNFSMKKYIFFLGECHYARQVRRDEKCVSAVEEAVKYVNNNKIQVRTASGYFLILVNI
jgi:hypothetical protein